MLIAEWEYFFVVASANVQQEVIRELACPQPLQDVCGLDLKPGCFWRDEEVTGVRTEETVLFVIQPDEAELVFRIELPIAAQISIGLVVDVLLRISRLIGRG